MFDYTDAELNYFIEKEEGNRLYTKDTHEKIEKIAFLKLQENKEDLVKSKMFQKIILAEIENASLVINPTFHSAIREKYVVQKWIQDAYYFEAFAFAHGMAGIVFSGEGVEQGDEFCLLREVKYRLGHAMPQDLNDFFIYEDITPEKLYKKTWVGDMRYFTVGILSDNRLIKKYWFRLNVDSFLEDLVV